MDAFVKLAILLIDILGQGISITQAYDRLKAGISAMAQREGRDITEEEMAFLKGIEEEAIRRTQGK